MRTMRNENHMKTEFDRDSFDKWVGPKSELAAEGKRQLAMYERAIRLLEHADLLDSDDAFIEPAEMSDDLRQIAEMVLRLHPQAITTQVRGKWVDPYAYSK